MTTTILDKFIELIPEKEEVMRKIWDVRKDVKTITEVIGYTPSNERVWFTNDPEKMLLCGATIPSSYSPSSESFKYLPTLVLQPYIGMIYVTDGDITMYIRTSKGNIEAPKYKCRAFVMCDTSREIDIKAKFPTYSERGYELDLEEFAKNKAAVITSNTPPIEIHLDCVDQFKSDNGHIAVCGEYITTREQLDIWENRYKGKQNDNSIFQ